jgi:hypothetical protein
MKTRSIVLITTMVTVLVSNIYPINSWIDTFVDENHYAYSNGDGTNTHIYNAFKGGDFYVPRYLSTATLDPQKNRTDTTGGVVELPAGKLLRKTYKNADTVMYRIFWKNPLTFWRWKYYIFGNEKFDNPYKNWDEIIRHRPFKNPENPTFQEF